MAQGQGKKKKAAAAKKTQKKALGPKKGGGYSTICKMSQSLDLMSDWVYCDGSHACKLCRPSKFRAASSIERSIPYNRILDT